jgi:phosphate butyryltransferase
LIVFFSRQQPANSIIMIKTLDQIEEKVLKLKKKHRIILIGKSSDITETCKAAGIDEKLFTVINIHDEIIASKEAVRLAKKGDADIVMKGLIGTDKFLRAVMDKEAGLMLAGSVLSYVGVIEIPSYHKLLFITDPAVIPFPDLDQKIAMAGYAIEMARRFGVEKPKIALIGASEKMSPHFQNSVDYAIMCKMADRGQIKNCVIDGPLDIFLACDKKSIEIKGVETPVNGDADILLFPSLESCNPFYKGLMLFAHGELAGLISGTEKPVIVMSRSESEKSKYFCITLACLMA